MIISLNWLKKYVDINVDIKTLAERIGSRLVEIEKVSPLADKYIASKATVVRVVDCVEHPDSDHLHVCRINDAGVNQDTPRDADGLIQVVCGAPNVRSGLVAVWLPPSAVVPDSYGTKDEFRLSSRKLRGVISYGMLASPSELDLWSEHAGIMEVDDPKIQPGTKFVDVLELEDYLIEVENKSLTHRPDCFGMIGFAREVSAILHQPAKIPTWLSRLDEEVICHQTEANPTITIADSQLCSHYECLALGNIDSSHNLPDQMRSYLGRVGVGSISAPVDITNYLMLETGQPLHTFDLDKVIELSPTGRADLIVRTARTGETLELLDGKVVQLDNSDIIIAVGDQRSSLPIALAGAMGGLATEITKATKRILLEGATFDLYHLRGTQFRHGIFSEAITRFTKGQPAQLVHPVILRAIELLEKYASARVVSQLASAGTDPAKLVQFNVALKHFSDVLGEYRDEQHNHGLTAELVRSTLDDLGYQHAAIDHDHLIAEAPWWRTDLSIAEDVIEDVGRVNGYDNLAGELPLRPLTATPYGQLYKMQSLLKDRLCRAGGNEVSSYSFVDGSLLDKVDDDKQQAYKIVNAISSDLQYYRRSLLPSLIEKSRDNLQAGWGNMMLFEVGKVHRRGLMDDKEPSLPAELNELAGVLVDRDQRLDSAYYTMKKIVEYAINIPADRLKFIRLDKTPTKLDSSTNLFEPVRSAMIVASVNGADYNLAVLGEFRATISKAFKLPRFAAGFSLSIDKLMLVSRKLTKVSVYQPLFRYQGTSRDITYQVADGMTFSRVVDFTRDTLAKELPKKISLELTPLGIYQPDEHLVNITLHIEFHDVTSTINVKLVNKVINRLAKLAETELPATVL